MFIERTECSVWHVLISMRTVLRWEAVPRGSQSHVRLSIGSIIVFGC